MRYAPPPPTLSPLSLSISLWSQLASALQKQQEQQQCQILMNPSLSGKWTCWQKGPGRGGGDKETARVSRDMKGEGEKGGAKRSLKWEAKSIKLHLLANSFKSQKPEMHTQCKHHPVPPTHTHTLPVTSTHTYSRVLDTLKCPGHKMCCETRCMRISHFGSFWGHLNEIN